jgi:DNA processing protein
LTSAGFVVVSGLARGIDTAAHAGAAAHPSGRTLAVLGNSLEQVYPPENQKLAEHILDGHGALISELPLNTGPAAEHFPRRNRIIAGLSLGVIVVEGTETSGALITARYAVDMDREVFAVPGPVDSPKSRGPHRLIKQGAKLVEDIEDVLEELRDISQHLVQLKTPDPRLRLPKAGPGPDLPLFDPAAGQEKGCQDGRPTLTDLRAQNLNPKEQTLFALLDPHTPTGVDVLIQKSGLPASEVLSTLLVLEVRRLCRQLPGKRFLKS